MSGFGGTVVWRHLDGTECCHRLAKDSEAPDGFYCAVTHSDVVLDDGGPRTGRITVVLADDEPVEPPPVETLLPVPPPSRYLNSPPPPRRRHRPRPRACSRRGRTRSPSSGCGRPSRWSSSGLCGACCTC